MKKILIADDDSVTRSMLSRMLKPYADSLEIMTAGDGKEATRFVDGNSVDLVVADLQLPMADGRALPAYIKDRYPGMPMIVMTAFGTPELRRKMEALSHTRYFEKPLNINELKASILDVIGSGKEGRINAASLSAVLQTAAREQNNCTLVVRSTEGSGRLFLLKGELVAAEKGELNGETAVYEMIGWKNAIITMEAAPAEKARDIQQSLATILSEGLKQKKEKERFQVYPSSAFTLGRGLSGRKRFVDNVSPAPLSLEKCERLEEPKTAVRPKEGVVPMRKKGAVSSNEEPPVRRSSHGTVSEGKRPTVNASLANLLDRLRNTDGILGFRIYDEQDVLKATYDTRGFCTRFKPADFWRQADGVKTEIGSGVLKYLVISTRKGVKYTIIQFHRRRIVIAAHSGYKASDLVKALMQ